MFHVLALCSVSDVKRKVCAAENVPESASSRLVLNLPSNRTLGASEDNLTLAAAGLTDNMNVTSVSAASLSLSLLFNAFMSHRNGQTSDLWCACGLDGHAASP